MKFESMPKGAKSTSVHGAIPFLFAKDSVLILPLLIVALFVIMHFFSLYIFLF